MYADARIVQKSIAEVAGAFVTPESYSLDIDRLLLGRESSLRTAAVGVLHIVIHGAEDLPKTDTVGQLERYNANFN
jgi:Ca2+-dependent lipid-binding protein